MFRKKAQEEALIEQSREALRLLATLAESLQQYVEELTEELAIEGSGDADG